MPALTAIISQTYDSILSELFIQNDIPHVRCQSLTSLIDQAMTSEDSDLTFISRDLLRDYNAPLDETFHLLRSAVKGSIYVLSSDNESSEIERFILAGATDVILHKQIKQVENILKSYRIYLDSAKTSIPYSVLLVEDSKSLQLAEKTYLESRSMVVHPVTKTEDALKKLATEKVDVIICDLVLEGDSTGLELVRQAYQNAHWRGIPILFTTSFASLSRQKHLYQLGIRDILPKPFDMEILYLKTIGLAKEHRIFDLLVKERKKIENLAYWDSDTNLNNRAFATQKYNQWNTTNTQSSYAVLIEIDDYHDIKRQYGISQCHIILKKIADIIREFTDSSSISAYLGGEQFLLLTSHKNTEEVANLAEKIIQSVDKLPAYSTKKLSVCIGVSVATESSTFDDLIRIADGCLYLAKDEGHGHYEIA